MTMKRFLTLLSLLVAITGFAADPINKATVQTDTNGVLLATSTNLFETNKTALLGAIGTNYVSPAAFNQFTQTLGSAATYSATAFATPADVVAATNALGSAAFTANSAYATAAQGSKADTAVQPADLATVATSGDYNDLLNKPSGGGSSSFPWNTIKVTNRVTTASTTFIQLTNMVLTFTNSSSTASVEVDATLSFGGTAGSGPQWRMMYVANGATNECWPLAPTPSGYTSMQMYYDGNPNSVVAHHIHFIHQPGTNRPTYYVEWRQDGSGGVSFNQTMNNTPSVHYSIVTSSELTLKGMP